MPNNILSRCMSNTNSIMYMHLLSDNKFDIDYQVHDKFEIYFIMSGTVEFFVERNIYIVQYGDIIIINNRELHKPLLKSNEEYERIIVEFDPAILSPFCLSDYNLLSCFTQRPKGEQNRICLNPEQIAELKRLYGNFETLSENGQEGAEILKLVYLVELLVFINGSFSNESKLDQRKKIPKKILPILDYIDNNLQENLSLQELASRYYIDKFYLSRLFLNITGINIHDYILSRRIFRAKELLRDGKSVLETSQLSGFVNYSTFIRSFKNLVGVLPRVYQKSVQN